MTLSTLSRWTSSVPLIATNGSTQRTPVAPTVVAEGALRLRVDYTDDGPTT